MECWKCFCTGAQVLAACITITYTEPLFLAAVAVVILPFYGVKMLYVSTSRQIKRLEAQSKAPIFAQFHETLTGLSTISAFGYEEKFSEQFLGLVETNLQYSYYR